MPPFSVVLGLGSNLSFCANGQSLEPLDILKKACRSIQGFLSGIKLSSVYTSAPMYVERQPLFYNMVVSGFFDGSAEQLLRLTQQTEAAYGRTRSKETRFGPRTLDIDIELFADMHIQTKTLHIPHPRLSERAFVLIPLLEILTEPADTQKRTFYEHCLCALAVQKTSGVHCVCNTDAYSFEVLNTVCKVSGIKKFCSPFKL
ncbi:2-amino-4-hydroxy-6-hydroxymethyldihydropteridine diphosphokinase [Treponema lecithinolyticum]|jgi:2-amino-4-hydroxy-6-hydroxymethyldihydropteridine pyrophosphokinase|uniref:2-amino-4-hydroxy-6- hydroxymethyldihydropteridine diphosphokinase n=1 Tax=Treponema lecithinolyticum TaxID=53418 RepID=UPI003FA1F6AB